MSRLLSRPPRSLRAARHLIALLPLSTPAATAQVWESCNVLHEVFGEGPGDSFGWVARRAGDLDGDGRSEVVVGAPGHLGLRGKVYVYSAVSGALLWSVVGGVGDRLGYTVASAGDLDGDGRSEILAGAPSAAPAPGRVLVLDGATGGVRFTLSAGAGGDRFGASVDAAGDVDADGVLDIIVGAVGATAFGANTGAAYVHSGATGASLWSHQGFSAGQQFGSAVGTIGDRDGDGHADVLVAAKDGGPGGRGAAWVFDGATGVQVGATLLPTATGASFGEFFAGPVGDLDRDGVADFFVSDWQDQTNGSTSGKVYVYSGATLGLLVTPTGARPGDAFGIGRGLASDVDGDGVPDLFFASYLADDGAANAGTAYVRSGASGAEVFAYHGTVAGATLGFDAEALGDVDGDGVDDYVVSRVPNAGLGSVLVLAGSPAPPLTFCPGGLHSGGRRAALAARRSTSLTTNALQLQVSGGLAGELAWLAFGTERNAALLGGGTWCVGGATRRVGAPITLSPTGGALVTLDLTGPAFVAVAPLGTYVFQAWMRDGAAGVPNTTNALAVTFCP